jgi:hypothetical protein
MAESGDLVTVTSQTMAESGDLVTVTSQTMAESNFLSLIALTGIK